MRISDWSSDVCSSDLLLAGDHQLAVLDAGDQLLRLLGLARGFIQLGARLLGFQVAAALALGQLQLPAVELALLFLQLAVLLGQRLHTRAGVEGHRPRALLPRPAVGRAPGAVSLTPAPHPPRP